MLRLSAAFAAFFFSAPLLAGLPVWSPDCHKCDQIISIETTERGYHARVNTLYVVEHWSATRRAYGEDGDVLESYTWHVQRDPVPKAQLPEGPGQRILYIEHYFARQERDLHRAAIVTPGGIEISPEQWLAVWARGTSEWLVIVTTRRPGIKRLANSGSGAPK